MEKDNSDIFMMQADKISREVYEHISGNLYDRIEVRQFEDEFQKEGQAENHNSFYSIIARDQLAAELQESGENHVISNSFYDNNTISFFVIFFKKGEEKLFQKFNQFFEKLSFGLFEFLTIQWKQEKLYFYNSSICPVLIRHTVDSLVTEISKKSSNAGVGLYDSVNLSLFNILSSLSYMTYERISTEGVIYFTDSKDNVDFQFEFQNPEEYGNFEIRNIKLIRKLLELTDQKKGIGIISDTNGIFGIGSIKEGADYYSVVYEEDHKWSIYEKEDELLTLKNNSVQLVNSLLTKRDFMNYIGKIFPEKADSEELSNIYSILKSLIKQHKGTILAVMKDAEKHIGKYRDLSMIINPVQLDEKNVEKLSSIDGAIITDENGICYGFGAVLDGLDTGTGNRARGSRYNSSERFYNQYKNEDGTGIMVFILSDDGNFNFFPPMD